MRTIQKNGQPEELRVWKSDFRQRNRKRATYADLQRKTDTRNIVKHSLLEEQHYICCYCEKGIEMENSHIEHFKPRSRFPDDQLNYQNMHASCLATRQEEEELSCGHNKDRYYDPVYLISPLDMTCGTLFRYTMNGEIIPAATEGTADWERARTTIERLNLNTYRLTRLRRAAIDVALLNDLDEEMPLSETEILLRMSDYEMPDAAGRLAPFCSSMRYMLEQELQVLRTQEFSQ